MQITLALGSNLGNRPENIQTAYRYIQNRIGQIEKQSGIIETESWGYSDADYLNSVICVETNLTPEELLSETQKIEREMGRSQKTQQNPDGSYAYSARIIDIDILFIENQIINTADLQIPHPQLHKRFFVMKPLSEISPDFIHPVLNKPISNLLIELS